jgi:deoxyadenosine/deoxycytidine kinase
MSHSHLRYVVVEGPIGSGKSALARRLASYWGVQLLAEDPAANPFLPRFTVMSPRMAWPPSCPS